MPPKSDNEYKDRPRPRRLFSFDSIKSSASSRNSSSDQEPPKSARPLNPFELPNVQEDADEHAQEPTIHAPVPRRSSTEPTPEITQSTEEQKRRLEPVRPIGLAPIRSLTALDAAPTTPSPTRARWENLRQHVLPAIQRPLTPPQRPPSAQSSVHSGHLARSGTPKPSRLARLGFKQVVEQAREVVDESRKFGEEILRACAAARYSSGAEKTSKERDIYGSTTLLPSTANVASSRMDYLRRPQSVSSLSLPSTGSISPPSLRHLYQILLYRSGTVGDGNQTNPMHLPHESQALATLLCPFLTPTKYSSTRIDDERTTAVEAFELVSKSWMPTDEAASIERCVWCTRAAACLPPTTIRTRILGSLYRLIVPGDRNRILLTTQGYQSLASGLMLLLVSLYRSSTSVTSTNNLDATFPRSPFSFASSNFLRPPHPDINLVQDLIPQYLSGSLGELEDDRVEEVYGVEFSAMDRRHLGAVRRAVFSEALVSCIENSPGSGEWLLCNAVEQYWPLPSFDNWTALQAAICCRKINTFCRLSLSLLIPFISRHPNSTDPTPSTPSTPIQPSRTPSSSSSSSSLNTTDFQLRSVALPWQIIEILQNRVIPEARALDANESNLDTKLVLEARCTVARVLLEFICIDFDSASPVSPQMSSSRGDVFGATSPRRLESFDSNNDLKGLVKWTIDTVTQWYRAGNESPWKIVLEVTFRQIITGQWTIAIDILSALLKNIPDDIKKPIFSSIMPLLNDQLVEEPPPYPFPRLSEFLTSLSRALPPVFFKPLFACAASDKEVIVVNHLCTLHIHSKYIADYWVRDVEMISLALMGDAGAAKTASGSSQWGSVRLGQLILLVELIGKIQNARHEKEAATSPSTLSDNASMETMKFSTLLEARLGLMIEFKERTTLIPPSQRMLLCILFREFRLLTRSLKQAPWLSRTLRWLEAFFADEYIGDLEKDTTVAMERVQGLYMAAQEGVQQSLKRHTSILAANVAKMISMQQSTDSVKSLDLAATFVEHRKLINSLSKGYSSKALKLFVAVSSLISTEEYQMLGPLLWEHCLLDNIDSSSIASACFLLMQCAEKTPMDVQAVIEVDLQTSDDLTRLEAVRKIGILINWRFQIMTQNFVSDRNHRPFKLARPPLPFVATDMGTSLYVHAEDPNETKDKDDVPLELRKRLADLGWAEEDVGTVDSRQEYIKTPFSILPASQTERLEVGTNDLNFGPSASPQGSPQPSPRRLRTYKDQQPEDPSALLRRNSSSGGPVTSIKRRAIFVPHLTLIFPRLSTLVFDSNFAVASAARIALLDLMRNDPGLLTRPIFDLLAGENADVQLATTTLTALLHVRRLLPPPLTHNVFNHLAGFLKLLAKNVDTADALRNFGLVSPTIASLAHQVSDISVREIRRAKMEYFLIPSGSLWFSPSSPKGPMFPRDIGSSNNPFELIPPHLISITMIRVSQNMFFLSMLRRNYQDVQVIRKNMSRLVLPSLDDLGSTKILELQDFMPRKRIMDPLPSSKNGTIEILSLMVARSYILLVAQIFRSMPRHMSDRHELAVLVDGLNRTLVVHGNDINIVSQVLIALMVASTRFRRLFTTGSGYTLFMPALVKVYTEAPSHPGIRVAIEYAVNRFYALHKESFLYQSINTFGQLSTLPGIDRDWFSKGVYDLFHSLRRGMAPSTIDVGGIHNANKAEEREALILHTADEKPQTFLAAIRRVETQTGKHMAFQLPDQYESAHLNMDDFIRLFLTVIAHDLSISRAQHFLRLLRFLTPHLYHSSTSARAILSDGITALGYIFTKVLAKPKGGENIPKAVTRDEDISFLSSEPGSEEATKKFRVPSDTKVMRLDYLQLVLSYGSAGGQVSLAVARHVIDITKSLLKDWGDTDSDVLASFLNDFAKMLLHREEPALPKAVVAFLQELSPLLHSNLVTLDFTGVFETILKLSETPNYSNDPMFCQVVVGEICTAGLAACDLAASENQLMTLQCRLSLVSLFAEAVFFRGVDIIAELEKRPPTYAFLTGIILPLTLTMKTEAHVIGDGLRGEQHRAALANAWLRLLFYAMTACQKSRRDEGGVRQMRGLAGSLRPKLSNVKDRQDDAFWRSHLPTFMTALQVIKVIIIRGTADISSVPRIGIWERLAAFFKSMLAEGNAEFALRSDASSTVTTPAGSPRSSVQLDFSSSGSRLFVSTSSGLNRSGSNFSNTESKASFDRPRIVDYSLWSILEFVCAYRSPLRMQLKSLTMEKVLALDQELQHKEGKQGNSGVISPFSASPSSRRISTSIFSKSRPRPSPDSSPRMIPSSSSLMPSPSLLEIPSRRAGYQVSPISPHERPPGVPKIVHLGPTSPSAFAPISSPLIGGLAGGLKAGNNRSGNGEQDTDAKVAKSTKIKSVKLIQETYRRIRGVQSFMGYELLLPIPGMGINAAPASKDKEDVDDDVMLETWSRSQAVAAIVKETNDMLEEFEESFGVDEESVLVDMDPRMSYSSN